MAHWKVGTGEGKMDKFSQKLTRHKTGEARRGSSLLDRLRPSSIKENGIASYRQQISGEMPEFFKGLVQKWKKQKFYDCHPCDGAWNFISLYHVYNLWKLCWPFYSAEESNFEHCRELQYWQWVCKIRANPPPHVLWNFTVDLCTINAEPCRYENCMGFYYQGSPVQGPGKNYEVQMRPGAKRNSLCRQQKPKWRQLWWNYW